jgi:hypothetical protein
MQQNSELDEAQGRRKDAPEDGIVRLINPELPSPNFFIVGAAKAGTTSMHAYLSQHPEVFMSTVKEPHYFSSFDVRRQFDNFMPVIRDSLVYQELFSGSELYKAVGEASPSYLCDAGAALRIKLAIPDAKIIISLRNPVQRAYSQYLMEYHEGNETLPFREALEIDEARSEKGWGVSFQYVELGLYADQVEHYLKVFGRSNVLVVLFEDFVDDTAAVMQQIAQFLGVDPDQYPERSFEKTHNPFEASRGGLVRLVLRCRPIRVLSKRWVPPKLRTAVRDRLLFKETRKPTLDDGIRRELASRFASDLSRLERMLDRDLASLRESE